MIPETIILDAQKKAWERKDELARLRQVALEKVKQLEEANKAVRYAEQQLRETLDFLQEYNPDAHVDWYAELGMTKK
jgi:hypothetical protein